jgi:ubiquinone/menaquinone biosynthesis C-methylase UbiE
MQMKEALDKFSEQSKRYQAFRPRYPKELYDYILSFVNETRTCWDCGTGNGQVAAELSRYFDLIEATDISSAQIGQAENSPNVNYSVQRAEQTDFKDDSFDLITVAQAAHWFDQKAFFQEVTRVAKHNSIIAIWGYGLPQIDRAVDSLLHAFYSDIIGPYWNKERQHIEEKYAGICFEYDALNSDSDFSIISQWNRSDFLGYLSSWSSVVNYKEENDGSDPVFWMADRLEATWKSGEIKEVQFPIFLKLSRISKKQRI